MLRGRRKTMDMVIWNWKPFSLWEQISNIYHPCFIAVVQEHARRSRDRDQSEVEVGFECCNFLAKFGVDPLLCRLLLKKHVSVLGGQGHWLPGLLRNSEGWEKWKSCRRILEDIDVQIIYIYRYKHKVLGCDLPLSPPFGVGFVALPSKRIFFGGANFSAFQGAPETWGTLQTVFRAFAPWKPWKKSTDFAWNKTYHFFLGYPSDAISEWFVFFWDIFFDREVIVLHHQGFRGGWLCGFI